MSAPVNEAAHGAVHGPEHGARVSRRPANKGQGEAFLVVDGRPAGALLAGEYTTGRAHLRAAAFAAFDRLCTDPGVDIVVAEGAGSPAEVNLRDGDCVNLGLAREFALPVVVVGDIDRGGLLAALYGTWALLDPPDRALLRAFVERQGGRLGALFRGDLVESGRMRMPRGFMYLGTLRAPRGLLAKSASERYLPVRNPAASEKNVITPTSFSTQTRCSAPS